MLRISPLSFDQSKARLDACNILHKGDSASLLALKLHSSAADSQALVSTMHDRHEGAVIASSSIKS